MRHLLAFIAVVAIIGTVAAFAASLSVNTSHLGAAPDRTRPAATNTGFRVCGSNSAVTSSSGDNNGYQTTPSNACNGTSGPDGQFAVDSGTGVPNRNSQTCTHSDFDRHTFGSFGFVPGSVIPQGASIAGIEVQVYVGASQNGGSPDLTNTVNPKVCVELSWNGGTNWTAAQSQAISKSQSPAVALKTFGSSTDQWGRVWSAEQLADSNFLIRITNLSENSGQDGGTFWLDWIGVKVYYQALP